MWRSMIHRNRTIVAGQTSAPQSLSISSSRLRACTHRSARAGAGTPHANDREGPRLSLRLWRPPAAAARTARLASRRAARLSERVTAEVSCPSLHSDRMAESCHGAQSRSRPGCMKVTAPIRRRAQLQMPPDRCPYCRTAAVRRGGRRTPAPDLPRQEEDPLASREAAPQPRQVGRAAVLPPVG